MILQVIASNPRKENFLFSHCEFPSNGPESVLLASLKSHLIENAKEDYRQKLSDFNLLCFLSRILPAQVEWAEKHEGIACLAHLSSMPVILSRHCLSAWCD